jgi:hypothetical protein
MAKPELRVVSAEPEVRQKPPAEPEVCLRRLYKRMRRAKAEVDAIERRITDERRRLARKRGLPTIWPDVAKREFDK